MGKDELAKENLEKSLKHRERFYSSFQRTNAKDQFLIDKFDQELYLARIEHAKYINDPMKVKMLMRAVDSKLKVWEADFNRQRSLLKKLKEPMYV